MSSRNSPVPALLAPGSSATAHAVAFPSRSATPPLDSRLVEPEGTDEIVGGRRLRASPSMPEHGDPHAILDALVVAHVAPARAPSSDLLTRSDADSDFATDTSVRTAGTDPATGERYLEELAFEVVHTQSARDVTEKAERLRARGVRRVFGVFVRRHAVCEWQGGGVWKTLPLDGVIDDPCLAVPLPVRAILDDLPNVRDVIARALIAQDMPAIHKLRVEEREAGREEGTARSILAVLDARGLSVTDELRARVLECRDAVQLEQWLRRAAVATNVGDVVDTPAAPATTKHDG